MAGKHWRAMNGMSKSRTNLAAFAVVLAICCGAATAMDVYVVNKTPHCLKFDAYESCGRGGKLGQRGQVLMQPGDSWKGVSSTWCADMALFSHGDDRMVRFGFDGRRDWKEGVAVLDWNHQADAHPQSRTMVKLARSRENGGFRIDILELGQHMQLDDWPLCRRGARGK